MDIYPLGHSSFKIKGKTATLVTDPKSLKVETESTFVVSGPGEYEIKGVFIFGLESDHKNTIYRIIQDGVKLLHVGDLGRKLSDDELNKIGDIDILFLPETATEIIAQLEPKIVILPTSPGVVPQPKLTISAEKLPQTTTVVVLE